MIKKQEANQRYSEAAEHINQEIDQLNSRRAALGKDFFKNILFSKKSFLFSVKMFVAKGIEIRILVVLRSFCVEVT